MNLDRASLATTPIELLDGTQSVSQGTGFFYARRTDSFHFIYLVTNHHVLTGFAPIDPRPPIGDRISFHLHVSHTEPGNLRSIQLPLYTKQGARTWISCASAAEADLAIIPLPFKCWEGLQVCCLDADIAKPVMKTQPTTPIAMIGYPYGLYDRKNALPIWKSGTIASEPEVDFEGKPVFLVDISAFPGMSGAPAFAYSSGGHQTLDGGFAISTGGVRQFMGIYASMVMRHDRKYLEEFTQVNKQGISDQESLQIGHVWKAKLIIDTIASIDNAKYDREILCNV